MQKIRETEITDGLSHPGENEAKCQDQSDAIVCAAESHQSIRGVAEAKQRAANFEIQIRVGRAGKVGMPGIKHDRQERSRYDAVAKSGRLAAVLPEKPRDFGPIAQHSPQMPKKPVNNG
jgi:hypothetical protein